ncbi:MAG TPA: alpha/beta hydrolase [Gammaproteobacteria bacterium]|nr:alpha/beta hydrolase [Gammaproteobacteria bacterium]|tara:strand:- start:21447 stop:22331 length:885 start_codon:yes stop_codon:yes gene_type:complete
MAHPQPKQHDLDLGGEPFCVFEWGQSGGQQILLVHATGFHARCWDAVVRLLPNDWHIFAVDMRGHGRSTNAGPLTWHQFGSDLLNVCAQLNIKDAIGVGHSMGGHCIVHACGYKPQLFRQLVLVDPVILSPELYQNRDRHQYEQVDDHPVARRRSHFASVAEMHGRYAERMPYQLWQPEIFRDYCEYGLLPAASGEGLELACPAKVEAAIYMGNFDADLYELIPTINTPTVVLRARPRAPGGVEMDFSASPTWPELAQQFPHGQDVLLPELTHFIPMQDPGLVADFIREGVAAG